MCMICTLTRHTHPLERHCISCILCEFCANSKYETRIHVNMYWFKTKILSIMYNMGSRQGDSLFTIKGLHRRDKMFSLPSFSHCNPFCTEASSEPRTNRSELHRKKSGEEERKGYMDVCIKEVVIQFPSSVHFSYSKN